MNGDVNAPPQLGAAHTDAPSPIRKKLKNALSAAFVATRNGRCSVIVAAPPGLPLIATRLPAVDATLPPVKLINGTVEAAAALAVRLAFEPMVKTPPLRALMVLLLALRRGLAKVTPAFGSTSIRLLAA